MATITASPALSSRSMRLTRRGRLVLTLLALAGCVLGLVMVGSAAFGRTAPHAPRHVVVQSGDTLWSLARAQAGDADPREVIAALREVNGLADDANLVPGQVLELPASE